MRPNQVNVWKGLAGDAFGGVSSNGLDGGCRDQITEACEHRAWIGELLMERDFSTGELKQ